MKGLSSPQKSRVSALLDPFGTTALDFFTRSKPPAEEREGLLSPSASYAFAGSALRSDPLLFPVRGVDKPLAHSPHSQPYRKGLSSPSASYTLVGFSLRSN